MSFLQSILDDLSHESLEQPVELNTDQLLDYAIESLWVELDKGFTLCDRLNTLHVAYSTEAIDLPGYSNQVELALLQAGVSIPVTLIVPSFEAEESESKKDSVVKRMIEWIRAQLKRLWDWITNKGKSDDDKLKTKNSELKTAGTELQETIKSIESTGVVVTTEGLVKPSTEKKEGEEIVKSPELVIKAVKAAQKKLDVKLPLRYIKSSTPNLSKLHEDLVFLVSCLGSLPDPEKDNGDVALLAKLNETFPTGKTELCPVTLTKDELDRVKNMIDLLSNAIDRAEKARQREKDRINKLAGRINDLKSDSSVDLKKATQLKENFEVAKENYDVIVIIYRVLFEMNDCLMSYCTQVNAKLSDAARKKTY